MTSRKKKVRKEGKDIIYYYVMSYLLLFLPRLVAIKFIVNISENLPY